MDFNIPDICLPPLLCTRLSFQIWETNRCVIYCKIINTAKKVICPDNDFTIEAIKACFTAILKGMCTRSSFSSQYSTLMIIIARSPGNRSLHQVRYYIATTVQHWRAKEKTQRPDAYVLPLSPRNFGDISFLFLILDGKIPKFTCVKFGKKLTSS